MKKTIAIAGIVIVFTCIILNQIFPLANQIEYFEVEKIKSITIQKGESTVNYCDDFDIQSISELIFMSEPTRKRSTHDMPIVPNYITLTIHLLENDSYTYYLYEVNSIWYVEQSYYGIYVIDQSIVPYI